MYIHIKNTHTHTFQEQQESTQTNTRRAHPFYSYGRFRTDRIATRVACGCGVPQTASADCCS